MNYDPDDDGEIVTAVAGEFVEKLGPDVLSHLREQEVLAADRGDSLSAEAWRDIADAAALILTHGN